MSKEKKFNQVPKEEIPFYTHETVQKNFESFGRKVKRLLQEHNREGLAFFITLDHIEQRPVFMVGGGKTDRVQGKLEIDMMHALGQLLQQKFVAAISVHNAMIEAEKQKGKTNGTVSQTKLDDTIQSQGDEGEIDP